MNTRARLIRFAPLAAGPALILAVWLAAAAPIHAGETTMDAAATTVTPVPVPRLEAFDVDGAGHDWGEAGTRVVAFAEDAVPPADPDHFAAHMRLGWTDAGLAVRVDLASNQPWREEDDTRNGYRADSMELFLRKGSAWKNLVQAVITPGLDKPDAQAAFAMWDYRGDPKEWADLPASIELARTRHKDGAVVEVLIPWKQLRIEPKAGLEVEFRINLNKVLSGQRRQWSWRRADGDYFQKLVLNDTPAPATNIAGWIDTSNDERIGLSAVAPAARAGSQVQLRQGARTLLTGTILKEVTRSAATMWLPMDAVDQAQGELALFLDDQPLTRAALPDKARGLALALERVMVGRGRGGRDDLAARLTPHLPLLLKAGPLPQASFPDPVLAQRAGALTLKTSWFDAQGEPVAEAKTPGRYAAMVAVTCANGRTERSYRNAVLVDAPRLAKFRDALGLKDLDDDGLRALLADGLNEHPRRLAGFFSDKTRDDVAERLWWHKLRTKLGTQTVYPYARRMPKDYDSTGDKRWPAILYLHGSGGGLPSQYGDMTERLKSAANRDLLGWAGGHPQPFAMYALQSNGGWEPPAVIDTLEKILAEDKIDPERVILMGFSMGGMGTWRVVTEYPDRFAAAVPIGGRSGLVNQMQRLGKLPVWIFNGDADRTTTLEDARRGEAALRKAGGDVRLTVLPDVGHGGSQNGTFETEELWDWLAARKRLPQSEQADHVAP